MRCATHPGVETELTCATCGTAICPDCMVQTPVGMKCRDCGRAPLPAVYRIMPWQLASGMAVAAALGALAAGLVLVSPFGVFAIFLGPVAGGIIGEAASRAAGWKRGPIMAAAATAACGAGLVLVGPQLAAAASGVGTLPWSEVLIVLVHRPFFLLFAGLAAIATFWRAG